jgi:hypothetical protein
VTDYRVLVAAVAFLLVLLWRVRPAFSDEESEAPVRGLDTAKSDAERVTLLAEAGEGFAKKLGGARRASACFSRAMRLAPDSRDLVVRASAALSRSPKVLESLLWRRLGSGTWAGEERVVAEAALGELVKIYDASSRTRPRARALENVIAGLGARALEKPAEGGAPSASA